MSYVIGQIFEEMYPAEAAEWCNANQAYIEEIETADGVRRFHIVALPEPTLEELVERAYRDFDSRVEARLDAFAATRRYNSIYTAKAAKDSHIAKYAAEGQYCELMWGETYAKCDQLLAEYMPEVLAGKRPIPTWEEIEAQLPPLVWPDEQNKDGGQVNE